jgi:hypothetical protein
LPGPLILDRREPHTTHRSVRGVVAMLMRTDPFREFDRLAQQMTGAPQGTWSRPTPMPMDVLPPVPT